MVYGQVDKVPRQLLRTGTETGTNEIRVVTLYCGRRTSNDLPLLRVFLEVTFGMTPALYTFDFVFRQRYGIDGGEPS